LLVASQPPTVSVKAVSCCISGIIGVSENRPIPIALASASSPIAAAALADGSILVPDSLVPDMALE
jgi:hypothetical protein